MQLQKPDSLIALFQELGFKSLMRDLPISHRMLSEASDIFTAEDPTQEPAAPLSQSEEIDIKLQPILRAMEQRGVKVDCAYLKELEEEFTRELDTMRSQLQQLAGQEFNPDSPSQVGHILYEVLQIPTKNIRKGKPVYVPMPPLCKS